MRTIISFIFSISTLLGLSLANQPSTPHHKIQSGPTDIKCIVMDLGGVLVDSSTSGAISEMGLNALMSLMYHHNGDQRAIKEAYFELLNRIECSNTARAYDENGLQLPSLMCDWLTGKRKNSEIY